MEYRNEHKYICNKNISKTLTSRLENVMSIDQNADEDASYVVRSLYFDDFQDTFYRENEAGVNERLKVRMRIYGEKSSIIKLEIKSKKNSFTKKVTSRLSREQAEKLITGERLDFSECCNDVLKQVYILMSTRLLQPKVIVEYDRTAFIHTNGNVRVTIDDNIRFSYEVHRFFEKNIYSVPLLDTDVLVVEVKYDEFLPDYIASSLEMQILDKTSFSKYYLSRKKWRIFK